MIDRTLEHSSGTYCYSDLILSLNGSNITNTKTDIEIGIALLLICWVVE